MISCVRQTDAVDKIPGPFSRLWHAEQVAKEQQVLQSGHPAPGALRLAFGHKADARSHRQLVRVETLAEKINLPRGRSHASEKHAHGRGFPRSVRTQESVDFPRVDFE